MAIAMGHTHDRSDFPRFFVSNPEIAGKPLAEFWLPKEYDAVVARVQRRDIGLLADANSSTSFLHHLNIIFEHFFFIMRGMAARGKNRTMPIDGHDVIFLLRANETKAGEESQDRYCHAFIQLIRNQEYMMNKTTPFPQRVELGSS